MKKLFAIVGGLALSLCVILSGCGHNMVELSCRCVFQDDKFKLPIPEKGLYEAGSISFDGYTLAEMKEKIDCADYGEAHITTYLSGNFLTIEKQDGKNRTHYYSLFQKENGRLFFSISGVVMECEYATDHMAQVVVIPYHLIDEREEWRERDWGWPSIVSNEVYSTSHSISEFVAFYEKLDELTVRIEENRLIAEMKEPLPLYYIYQRYWRLTITFSETGVSFYCEAP